MLLKLELRSKINRSVDCWTEGTTVTVYGELANIQQSNQVGFCWNLEELNYCPTRQRYVCFFPHSGRRGITDPAM